MDIQKTVGIQQEPIQTRDGNDKYSLLKEARERAQTAYSYYKGIYKQAAEDVEFLYKIGVDYEGIDEDNRLHLDFNRLPQFVNRVVGAQRNEVQSIDVVPTEEGNNDAFTTDTGKQIDKWEALSDIIRDIEYRSNAIAAYKTAFKQAVEGGFGWLRVLTEYKKNSFDLDIRIKGIRDRWSVIIDPKVQESDMSDANYAFITEKMSRKEFQKRYPGKTTESIIGDEEGNLFWGDEETVTVAEYFRREPYKKTIVLLSNGGVVDKKEINGHEQELAQQGILVVKQRIVTEYRVIWCKLSAQDILEGEIEFPTSTIPIVPVLGRVVDAKQKRYFYGLIRDAKGAQTALNKTFSSALERIDDSPLSPFIAEDKAIEGYEDIWAEANTKKYSVLPYKKGEQMPQRLPGSTVPAAELNIIPELDNAIKNATGIFNASLGQRSNETSGIAIRARQSEGDVGTYEFIDNYRNAIRRIGLLITEMIPKIYDTERKVTLRKLDNTTGTLTFNKMNTNMATGQTSVENVLGNIDFDVRITAGATYNTKREENAEQILKLMQVNPQIAQVGSDLLVRNLDFSESNVLADRLEKTIPPNLLSEEKRKEVMKDMPQQQQQPDPAQIKAEADIQKAQIALQIEQIKLEEAKIGLQQQQLQANVTAAQADQQRKQQIADNIAKSITNKNEVQTAPNGGTNG